MQHVIVWGMLRRDFFFNLTIQRRRGFAGERYLARGCLQ
jgi:hypothetical protein